MTIPQHPQHDLPTAADAFPSSPELEDLAEQIGLFMEYWGFKKVHGQIWCHLYLSTHNLDASDLMQRLRISKALVSISLKELMEFGVIEETPKSERATKTYTAKIDITAPVLEIIRRRERRMVSRVLAAYHLLAHMSDEEKARMAIDAKKLMYLGHLIKLAEKSLDSIVNRAWGPIIELVSLQAKIFRR